MVTAVGSTMAEVGPSKPTARMIEMIEEEVGGATTVVTDGRCQRKGSKDAADILMTLVDTPSTTATAANTKPRSVFLPPSISSEKQEMMISKHGSETESTKKLSTKPDCTISKDESKHQTKDDNRQDVGENDDTARIIEFNGKKDLPHNLFCGKPEEEEAKSNLVGKQEVSYSPQEYDSGNTKHDEEEDKDLNGVYDDNDGDDCTRDEFNTTTKNNSDGGDDNDDDDDDDESCSSESQSSNSKRSFFFYGCYNHLCNRDDGACHDSRHHNDDVDDHQQGFMSTDSTTTRTRGSTTAFSYPPNTSIASNTNNSTTFRTRSVASLSFFSSSFDHDDEKQRQDANDNDTTLLDEAVERLTEEKRRTIVFPDVTEPFKSDQQQRQQDDGETKQSQMARHDELADLGPNDGLPSLKMIKPYHNAEEAAKQRDDRVEAVGASSKSLNNPNSSVGPSTSKMPRISSIRSSSSHPTALTTTRRHKSKIVDFSLQTGPRADSSDESNGYDGDEDQPIIVTLPSQQDDRDEVPERIVDEIGNYKEEDEDELEKMVHELKRIKKRLSKRHHPYLQYDRNDDHLESDESIKTLQKMIDDLEGMKFIIQSKNTKSPPTDKNTPKESKNRWLIKSFISRIGRKSLFRGFSKKRDDSNLKIKLPISPDYFSDSISSAEGWDDFRSSPSSPKKGFMQERHRRLKAISGIVGSRIRMLQKERETKVTSNHASAKILRQNKESTKGLSFDDEDVNGSVNTTNSIENFDQERILLDRKHHTISEHDINETDPTHAINNGLKPGVDDTKNESIASSRMPNAKISSVEEATYESAAQSKAPHEEVEGGDILDHLCENIEKHLCRGCERSGTDIDAPKAMSSMNEQTLQKI